MIEIGRFNSLEVIQARSNGLLLAAGQSKTLMLPIEQVSHSYQAGERIDVFIYLTADGQPAATTAAPLAEVGQVAWLEIVDVTEFGFLRTPLIWIAFDSACPHTRRPR